MQSIRHGHVVRQFLTVSAGFLLGASAQVAAQHALQARDGVVSIAGAARTNATARPHHGIAIAITHCESDTVSVG